jgi:hypothetical protein
MLMWKCSLYSEYYDSSRINEAWQGVYIQVDGCSCLTRALVHARGGQDLYFISLMKCYITLIDGNRRNDSCVFDTLTRQFSWLRRWCEDCRSWYVLVSLPSLVIRQNSATCTATATVARATRFPRLPAILIRVQHIDAIDIWRGANT